MSNESSNSLTQEQCSKLIESLRNEIKCIICFELPLDPVQCLNCTNVFCDKCVDQWIKASCSNSNLFQEFLDKKKCPMCKQKLKTTPSFKIKGLIDLLPPSPCTKNCGLLVPPNQRQRHLTICPKQTFQCKFDECRVEGDVKLLMVHLLDIHYKHFLSKSSKKASLALNTEMSLLQQPLYFSDFAFDISINNEIVSDLDLDTFKYSGQIKNNEPCGFGLMEKQNVKIFGYFEQGIKKAFVNIIDSSQNNSYQYFGFIRDGLRHGIGHYMNKKKTEIEGIFLNNKAQGYGWKKWANGKVGTGIFVNGKINGQGKIRAQNNYYYHGDIKDDLPHGIGNLTTDKILYGGNFFRGEISQSEKGAVESKVNHRYSKGFFTSQGEGQETKVSNFSYTKDKSHSDEYFGQVKDFVKFQGTGQLKLNTLNGMKFKGQFNNDQIVGEGQLIFKNGSICGGFDHLHLIVGEVKIFFNEFTENLEGKAYNLDITRLKNVKNLQTFLMEVSKFNGMYYNIRDGVFEKIDYDYKEEENQIFINNMFYKVKSIKDFVVEQFLMKNCSISYFKHHQQKQEDIIMENQSQQYQQQQQQHQVPRFGIQFK